MKLVTDWRDAYKWASMHSMGWSAGLLLTWTQLPPGMKSSVPAWTPQVIVAVVLLCGMIGRVVDQAPSKGAGAEDQAKPQDGAA